MGWLQLNHEPDQALPLVIFENRCSIFLIQEATRETESLHHALEFCRGSSGWIIVDEREGGNSKQGETGGVQSIAKRSRREKEGVNQSKTKGDDPECGFHSDGDANDTN